MGSDLLILQCPNPECNKRFSVCVNSVYKSDKEYGLENAPLFAIGEINEESKHDRIRCLHCGISVYLEVCFTVKTRYLSCREQEGKMDGLPWQIA